jgi:hypothetical protein
MAKAEVKLTMDDGTEVGFCLDTVEFEMKNGIREVTRVSSLDREFEADGTMTFMLHGRKMPWGKR